MDYEENVVLWTVHQAMKERLSFALKERKQNGRKKNKKSRGTAWLSSQCKKA